MTFTIFVWPKTPISAQKEAVGDTGARNNYQADMEKVIFNLFTVYKLIDIDIVHNCKPTWIG